MRLAPMILLAALLTGCEPGRSELVKHNIPPALLEPVAVPEIPPTGAPAAQIAVSLIEAFTALWDANARIEAICVVVRGAENCAPK